MDVKALFTNILHQEGLDSLKIKLISRINQEIPSSFIQQLMEIILKCNIFTFNQDNFVQEIGAAMGSPPMPSYADIFMAIKIDPIIYTISRKYNEIKVESLKLFKRYLDDIFLYSEEQLKIFTPFSRK